MAVFNPPVPSYPFTSPSYDNLQETEADLYAIWYELYLLNNRPMKPGAQQLAAYTQAGGNPISFNPANESITITILTGSPKVGDLIHGSLSGANGTIVGIPSVGTILVALAPASPAFIHLDAIAGSISGFTATVNVVTAINQDQQIVLSGGTNFVITDIVFTNVSAPLLHANGGQFYTGAARTGSHIANINNLPAGSSFRQM